MSAPAKAALDHALKLLAHRARSEAEVRRRLARSGFEEGDVDAAVQRLRELRFLDDRSFAAQRAEKLLTQGGLGPAAVVQRLEAAGIGEADAESAVGEARAGASELELARAVLARRRPKVDGGSPQAEKVRAARWLAGKGFAEDVVREALELRDE